MVIFFLIVLGLVSLGGGIFCLVRFARTRQVAFLVVGLLLTLIVPGALFLAALGGGGPDPFIVYAPPPPDLTP